MAEMSERFQEAGRRFICLISEIRQRISSNVIQKMIALNNFSALAATSFGKSVAFFHVSKRRSISPITRLLSSSLCAYLLVTTCSIRFVIMSDPSVGKSVDLIANPKGAFTYSK